MSDLQVDPAWEVHPAAVKASLDKGEDFLLLDVRLPKEWQVARVEGAVLLPLQELETRLGELEASRDRPVVVMCHHGVRSRRATAFLRAMGFSNVSSMAGGIEAWTMLVDPSVPRY